VKLFRVVALAVTIAGAVIVGRPYVHGLSFVIRAADMQGTARRLADLDAGTARERELAIPTARGSMRSRIYEPAGRSGRTALLVSGLHASGIDEPRLIRLARQLAANHITVVTPDIPELSRFVITPQITDTIEESARWLATESQLAADGRVGLMGISFSGGLSLVAAGRPSLASHVSSVFAFGGHDDLPRVLRYLCTGQEPYPQGEVRLKAAAVVANGGKRVQADSGELPFTRPPHDYGVAVILLGVADRVVPRPQVEPLRETVRHYLWASALDGGVDKARADKAFASVRAEALKLPEPAKTLARYAIDRDVVHLGARLLPYVNVEGGDPALSLSKSPKPSVPVFLLHGVDDNVIPSVESEYIANDLRSTRAPVRLLLSGLISHAEADRPVRVGDVLELASFWGDLLSR
jgi:dienelactone hydrolase